MIGRVKDMLVSRQGDDRKSDGCVVKGMIGKVMNVLVSRHGMIGRVMDVLVVGWVGM